MSTLFESYYDCLGHELYVGSYVGFQSKDHTIYGTVIDIKNDKDDDYKFVVIPNIGCRWSKGNMPTLKKRYTVSWKRIYLINVKKK